MSPFIAAFDSEMIACFTMFRNGLETWNISSSVLAVVMAGFRCPGAPSSMKIKKITKVVAHMLKNTFTPFAYNLPDCKYEGMLEFLRFLYTEEVNLSSMNVMQVLYLAEKYMVPSLTKRCNIFLNLN